MRWTQVDGVTLHDGTPRSHRSSSANSLTFHGYRVVIDTSAAWSSAEERNRAPKVMAFRTSPVTVETANAAAGSTGPARPIARLVVCGIRCLGGASKAVAAAAPQRASFSARAMPGMRRAAVAL